MFVYGILCDSGWYLYLHSLSHWVLLVIFCCDNDAVVSFLNLQVATKQAEKAAAKKSVVKELAKNTKLAIRAAQVCLFAYIDWVQSVRYEVVWNVESIPIQ